jgi:DNA recombination protein Rad52
MGFSAKQVQALRRNLDHRYIRTREANGRELSYIEGWYAITEANRIFGFDGWNREILESRCVLARENRGTFLAVYIARVRITVHADGATIIREGHGTGEGRGTSPGEAHDFALKAAETDGTKRALVTFGKPFSAVWEWEDSSRHSHAFFAAVSRRVRIICALRNPEPSVLKSATNLLFRFVAAITDSCIRPAMKRHGGTTWISIWRLPKDFGRRAG